MENKFFTGAIDDPRPLHIQLASNYRHEEIFPSMGVYPWQTIPESEWKMYRIRNQNGSGKCGPFSLAKALGRNNDLENGEFIDLDTDYIYQKRRNLSSGMWLDDLLDIGTKYGTPSDPTLLSDNNTDSESALRTFTPEQVQEALKYRSKNRAYIYNNFDSVAQAIDAGQTVIFNVHCAAHEWTSEPFVDPNVTPSQYNIHHFVPGHIATMHNGKKKVVIDDSWGSAYGANGRRLITEDFYNKRITVAGYPIDLKNEVVIKPKYFFTKKIGWNDLGIDVIAWQKILQYEKFLATHTSTGELLPLGKWGPMTARATVKWQIAHGFYDFENETDMSQVVVGPKSRKEANMLYPL